MPGLLKAIPASSKGIGSDIFKSPLRSAALLASDKDPDRLALWLGDGMSRFARSATVSPEATDGTTSTIGNSRSLQTSPHHGGDLGARSAGLTTRNRSINSILLYTMVD